MHLALLPGRIVLYGALLSLGKFREIQLHDVLQ